jgi:hypothetical protein
VLPLEAANAAEPGERLREESAVKSDLGVGLRFVTALKQFGDLLGQAKDRFPHGTWLAEAGNLQDRSMAVNPEQPRWLNSSLRPPMQGLRQFRICDFAGKPHLQQETL